jgi:hypothetical protein
MAVILGIGLVVAIGMMMIWGVDVSKWWKVLGKIR